MGVGCLLALLALTVPVQCQPNETDNRVIELEKTMDGPTEKTGTKSEPFELRSWFEAIKVSMEPDLPQLESSSQATPVEPGPLQVESSFENLHVEPVPLKVESSFETLPTNSDPPQELVLEAEAVLVIPDLPELESLFEAEPILTEPQELRAMDEFPTLMYPNPLDDVWPHDAPLVDKIISVDSQVCGGSCYGSYPSISLPNRWGLCQACSCDIMCQVYRDCCPDVLIRHNISYDETPSTMGCQVRRAVVYNPDSLGSKDYQAMVTHCPAREVGGHTFSQEVQEKCEQPDIQERDQAIPVSSPRTGLTYRNVFCALCHSDDSSLDQWVANVECAGSAGPLISSTHTREGLYRKLVNQTSVSVTTCELVYSHPSPTNPDTSKLRGGNYNRPCTKIYPPLINTCNSTGQATFVDADIAYACALYESVFDGKYRNIFCYVCNQQYPHHLQQLINMVHGGISAHTARVSFAALLDLGGQDTWAGQSEDEKAVDMNQCGATQFFDVVTCECREKQCGEGKYLDKNGTCQSLIKSNMLGYRACHRLDLAANSSISEEILQILRDIASFIVENNGVREHRSDVLQFCPDGLNVSLHFEDLFTKFGTLEDLEELINKTREWYVTLVETAKLESAVSSSVTTVYPCLETTQLGPQCLMNLGYSANSIRRVGPIMFGARTDIYYINYTQTSACAFVSLSRSNFTVAQDGEKVRFEPTGNDLSTEVVSFADAMSSVRMCLSDYLELDTTRSCQAVPADFDTWTISGLVSIVCTSVSLVCLALTFAVYLILAPLRVGGGKNIMVLTVSLFVAQALYEFGIEQFENKEVCRAVGLAVHYSWLAAVFSMNACTVERFLKLCFPLRSRSFFLSERRPFLLATSYSFLCPLVIVVINVAVSMASIGDLGYGSPSLCYINSRLSRIVAFAVPVGSVVVVNVALLCVTVWALRKQSELNQKSHSETAGHAATASAQSTKHHRVGLLGCVRLSVVTGITWLLVFLYQAIPSEALGYVITGLVGLQGLVFFLSMVVNKRVLGMLRKKVTSSTTSTSSSGSNSGKNKTHRNYKVKETVSDQLSDSKTGSKSSL